MLWGCKGEIPGNRWQIFPLFDTVRLFSGNAFGKNVFYNFKPFEGYTSLFVGLSDVAKCFCQLKH